MNWLTASPPGIRPRALYEAARNDRPHRSWRDSRDGDATVAVAGERLRRFARHLEQNHDVVRGALDRLVQFVVGPSGIGIEPLPRRTDGSIHTEFSRELKALWDDWIEWPDVTWEMDWATMQRMAWRTVLRDGEVFGQIVAGDIPTLNHGTLVPLSVELIEADQLPLDFDDRARGILQSVEKNAWGRPRAYHVLKQHPGSVYGINTDRKRVPAEYMVHARLFDRVRQTRGVSALASVISRLNDLHEYETSERTAARIAANIAGAIKKGSPDLYQPEFGTDGSTPAPREIYFQPGMIFDDLRPGESVEIIEPKRPNPAIEGFRSGQLRAAAAGIGTSYSSLSRDYNGTWSSQRQELVEQHGHYQILSSLFIFQFVKPIRRWHIDAALAARLINIPVDLDPRTLYGAVYSTPPMPWIDPAKEIEAHRGELDLLIETPQQIIRRRGRNPQDVIDEWAEWNRMLSASDQSNGQEDNANAVVQNSSRRR